MQQEYLLDTNAFFNLLKASNENAQAENPFAAHIKATEKASVSLITKVEIISVLGKGNIRVVTKEKELLFPINSGVLECSSNNIQILVQ